MKNFLSIFALISVLLLAGCTFNCKNDGNDNEEVKNVINENVEIDSGEVFNEKSGEVIADDETEEELIAKYKLADTMTLEIDYIFDDIGKDVLSSNPVISEDIEIKGEIYKLIVSSDYPPIMESDKNYVQIGNKKITDICDYVAEKAIIKVEDDYFIFLLKSEGSFSWINAYKVTDDFELELIEGVHIDDIRKIGEKYIIPRYLNVAEHYILGTDTSYIMGYYYYEDGEWKYINRSLNGKKIIDDDGNLSEEINIERIGYGVGSVYGWLGNIECIHKNEGVYEFEYEQVLLTKSKYRVKRISGDTYDIEMLEDSEWGDVTTYSGKNEIIIENKKIMKAGTIVKNLVRPIVDGV